MIRLATDCRECVHEKMCKYKNNAVHAMNKLSSMTYGTGPNDDYDWKTTMEFKHVTVTFSCPDFKRNGGNFR